MICSVELSLLKHFVEIVSLVSFSINYSNKDMIDKRSLRPSGIEPEAIAWEAMILPLNQERGVFSRVRPPTSGESNSSSFS